MHVDDLSILTCRRAMHPDVIVGDVINTIYALAGEGMIGVLELNVFDFIMRPIYTM